MTREKGQGSLAVRLIAPQGFFSRRLDKEIAMFGLDRAYAEPEASGSAKELAEQRLRSNPYLSLKNISSEYLDGVLVLRGYVPTYYLKQMAQEVVTGLEGVERIDNQIEVMTFLSDRISNNFGQEFRQ
jgi:osmotically-inducible protein OsmY